MSFSKYERQEFVNSKYCYDDTDVLKNKLNILDWELLKEAEVSFTTQRILELVENPIKGKFTISHLQNIHKYIFQDLYGFAGKIRKEDIFKGGTMFCKWENIKENLVAVLANLKKEHYLVGLDEEAFCIRAAYYLSEINLIHPFRDGNGRAIRELIRFVAINAGYDIDWSKIMTDELL